MSFEHHLAVVGTWDIILVVFQALTVNSEHMKHWSLVSDALGSLVLFDLFAGKWLPSSAVPHRFSLVS